MRCRFRACILQRPHRSYAEGVGPKRTVHVCAGLLLLRLPAWQRRRSVLVQPHRQRIVRMTTLWPRSGQCSA